VLLGAQFRETCQDGIAGNTVAEMLLNQLLILRSKSPFHERSKHIFVDTTHEGSQVPDQLIVAGTLFGRQAPGSK
jgi:hypothetical protein